VAVRRRFPIRSLLVFWLFLLSAIAFLDRDNISIAGAPSRRTFASTTFSWVGFQLFLLGYAAFQVVGGWLACRFRTAAHPRQPESSGGASSPLSRRSPTKALHAFLDPDTGPVLSRAGEAVMYPASINSSHHWFPVAERGRANGWIFAGVGAGPASAFPS